VGIRVWGEFSNFMIFMFLKLSYFKIGFIFEIAESFGNS